MLVSIENLVVRPLPALRLQSQHPPCFYISSWWQRVKRSPSRKDRCSQKEESRGLVWKCSVITVLLLWVGHARQPAHHRHVKHKRMHLFSQLSPAQTSKTPGVFFTGMASQWMLQCVHCIFRCHFAPPGCYYDVICPATLALALGSQSTCCSKYCPPCPHSSS